MFCDICWVSLSGPNVYNGLVHNSQTLERVQMSINRGMAKEDVEGICVYVKIYIYILYI